jgi:hypothetical protein
MMWVRTNRFDPETRALADRHYNRQKPGTPQFVPPGRCLVLLSKDKTAFWVTSYPFAQYVKHAWAGAFVCSAFRNEGEQRASDLIRDAVSATLSEWPSPPLGMITFIDRKRVRPIFTRGKKRWGYVYEKAGFEHVGFTKGGLMAWQLSPDAMPEPKRPSPHLAEAELPLFGGLFSHECEGMCGV